MEHTSPWGLCLLLTFSDVTDGPVRFAPRLYNTVIQKTSCFFICSSPMRFQPLHGSLPRRFEAFSGALNNSIFLLTSCPTPSRLLSSSHPSDSNDLVLVCLHLHIPNGLIASLSFHELTCCRLWLVLSTRNSSEDSKWPHTTVRQYIDSRDEAIKVIDWVSRDSIMTAKEVTQECCNPGRTHATCKHSINRVSI